MDGGKLGPTSRNGHDRHPQLPMEEVEVEDVETSHHRAVQKDGMEPFEPTRGPYEPYDLLRRVAPVHPYAADANRLDAVGGRDGDGGERGPAVRPAKGPVVDADHAYVQLRESRTQR
jgi:hypothetical protein